MKRATAVRLAAIGGVTAALAGLTTAHAAVGGGEGRGGGATFVATSTSGWADASSYAVPGETVQIITTVEDLTSNTAVASCTTSGDSGPFTSHCSWTEVPGDWYQVSITGVGNGVVWVWNG